MGFNAQRYSNEKVINGTWCEIMGGHFLIARSGNEHYLEAQERNGKRKATSAVERRRALYRSIAEGILLDWKEVNDYDGNAIPYSLDAVIEVLVDNPDLVELILEEALSAENYLVEDIADQKKKPLKRSATS